MLVTGGITAYLAVYFAIGWWLAKRDLPRVWAVARKKYERYEDLALDRVKESTTFTFLFWPIRLPVRAFNGVLDSTVVSHDPREQVRQIEEARAQAKIRERYIASLEKELDINTEKEQH